MATKVNNAFQRFDWVLTGIIVLLMVVGLLNIYSSSIALQASPKPPRTDLYITQAGWLGLGALLAGSIMTLDYRIYERWAYVAYGAVIALLLGVLLFGSTLNGSTRWLNLQFFFFQPSELMKVAIILCTARYVADRPRNEQGADLFQLAPAFGLLALPMILIMLQPDLGTSLVIAFICLTILVFEGIHPRTLFGLIMTAVLSAPFAWSFVLKDYQKGRILSFLDLEKDSFGAGWQVRQSLIAFGSGGLTGKGHLAGTQVQMGFIPYHESDFAAVNWAEEHGFLGMIFLLLLYLSLIAWALHVAHVARDRFGVLVAVGVAAMVFWHVVINLGMVLGMLPVVGLTLPLVSYGGSSTLTVMIALGLLLNVSLRRHLLR